MANYHFFTDADLLNAQTSGQAFGPVPASLTPDEYRITSYHTSTADAKAYAICDGIICAQQTASNPSLLNIILRPLTKPGIEFSHVDYFIYKGIKLNSLLDGTFIQTTGNDLVEMINQSKTALNASIDRMDDMPEGTTTDRATAEALGYHLDDSIIPDSDSMDKLFFRSDSEIQLPVVKAGDSIGLFGSAGFGLEIISCSVGYTPKLEIARRLENSIIVDPLSTPTDAETFRHWNRKEEILNFIDPAAFFGAFYTSKLKVTTSGGTTSGKSKDEIYSDVLTSFYNKNKIYVDIRNEHNFSLNYYGNYGNEMELGFNGGTVEPIDYNRAGWPLLIVNADSFALGNTGKKNVISIKLPAGDNESALLFMNTGIFNRGNAGSKLPGPPKKKKRFLNLVSEEEDFLRAFEIAVPNCNSGDTTPVASYVKLTLGRTIADPGEAPVSSGTVMRSRYHLDHLFLLQAVGSPFTGNALVRTKVFSEDRFMASATVNKPFCFVRTGIAFDNYNVTYFSFPVVKKNTEGQLSLTSGVSNETAHFLNYFDNRLKATEIKSSELAFSGTSVQLLENVESAEALFPKIKGVPKGDPDTITLRLSEYSALQALATSSFDPEFKVFFALNNKNGETELDDNDQPFTRFDMVLQGYKQTADIIEVLEVNTNLKIYSDDTI